MRQKFRKLTFVKVTETMPPEMRHFPKGFVGIVDGTYAQIYGGTNIDSYGLYVLENGCVVNRIAWYKENQLTALPEEEQDRLRAEEMIEEYIFRD